MYALLTTPPLVFQCGLLYPFHFRASIMDPQLSSRYRPGHVRRLIMATGGLFLMA